MFPYKHISLALFFTTNIPTISNALHHYSIMNFPSILTVFWFLSLPKTGGHFSHTNFHVLTLQRPLLKCPTKQVYTSLQIFTLTPPCGQLFLTNTMFTFPFLGLDIITSGLFIHMLAIMHTLHISPRTLCTTVSTISPFYKTSPLQHSAIHYSLCTVHL